MSKRVASVPVQALVEHRDFIRALARTPVRDPSRADDLEQDVWLTTLSHPPRHTTGLRGWLRRIVRSRAVDMARRDARREGLHVGMGTTTTSSSADLASRLDAGRRVAAAVARLDEPYRSTVLLRFYEDLEASEISVRTGVPLDTVRTRLRRAIERIRADLDSDAGGRASWLGAIVPLCALPTGDALTSVSGTCTAKLAGGVLTMGAKATIAAAVLGGAIGALLTAQIAGGGTPSAPPEVLAAAPDVGDLGRRLDALESRIARPATRAVESRIQSQDERIAALETALSAVEAREKAIAKPTVKESALADEALRGAGDSSKEKRREKPEKVPDLILKLRRTIADTSQSEAKRLEALAALRRLPNGIDREVVLALTELFRSTASAATRDSILRDLHGANGQDLAVEARQLYLEGLRDADEEVRERAAEDIDTFVSDADVRQALELAASSDPSKGVRKCAARTLEKSK